MTTRHPIPDAALDDRLGFLGMTGSGKTYGAGTVVERVLRRRGPRTTGFRPENAPGRSRALKERLLEASCCPGGGEQLFRNGPGPNHRLAAAL
jgi:hypothetical protein